MIDKITEEELEFMECWHTPECLIESLFEDFDNLTSFNAKKLGDIRKYQIPMLSHEYIVDAENYPNATDKEKFNMMTYGHLFLSH